MTCINSRRPVIEPRDAEARVKLITNRLKATRKGILLFHQDPNAQTAAMRPAFLRDLGGNGHHLVHWVPAAPVADKPH